MASSVLGKRSRTLEWTSERTSAAPTATPRAWRAKRRLLTCPASRSKANDENENPFVIARRGYTADDVDELSPAAVKTPRKGRRVATPSESHNGSSWVALSPTKINTHFKSCKILSPKPEEKAKENVNLLPHTPQTPRYRDVTAGKVPITPRRRVTPIGKPWTPRTPRTPSTSNPSVYNVARQLFVRNSNPGRLVGREEERSELRQFIHTRVETWSGGAIYVSGPPGTGKSALVNEVCQELALKTSTRLAYVNCMSIRNGDDLNAKLVEDLGGDGVTGEDGGMEMLKDMCVSQTGGRQSVIVILDEIDHLLTVDLDLLYTLFEWSLQPATRLILVGIANALDLTDRFLPRLKTRNLKPQLLPFLPYSATQINNVLTSRLRSLLRADTITAPDYVPFFHPAAINLCARKVASQTGDLRRAYEISRRAVDLVERETRQRYHADGKGSASTPTKAPLMENANLSSPASTQSSNHSPHRESKTPTRDDPLQKLTVETAPRVTIAHIGRVAAAAFGNGTAQRLQSLNLQQKAALCALMVLEKRKRLSSADTLATPSKADRAAPTVRALFDAYASLCKRDAVLHPLTSTEFRDVVESLETLSLVSAVDGRTGAFMGLSTPSKKSKSRGFGAGQDDEKRVASCVGEQELSEAVEGIGSAILRGILNGAEWE
ncbi:MAG: AAA ATPase [Thelocarpon superellum]|nr:MAG: AAA ATPase [Thelocarpon superellum]KAI9842868.1 MAG: AAA ATPase [Thelocarpon superellum]